MSLHKLLALSGALVLAACGEAPYDPRGVDRDEINGRASMHFAFLAAAVVMAVPLATAPLPAAAQQSVTPALAQALADPRRDADRARDVHRNPGETLTLFRLEPGMTVVDYVPDQGWYTRIIAPYLGPNGRYIAMGPDVTGMPEGQRNYWGGQADKLRTRSADWNLGSAAALSGFNTDAVPAELAGTVDRVFIFRELHNILRNDWLHDDMLAIRRLLKPGGMVGIEQHRADPDAPYAMTDGSKGYLREQDVIALFDLYGFDLVASSEVNANPKDPKDWPQGVWMLPPNFRAATDATRPRLTEIGESDRMTMLFRKRD
jgi:predicted methyltransferase